MFPGDALKPDAIYWPAELIARLTPSRTGACTASGIRGQRSTGSAKSSRHYVTVGTGHRQRM